MDGSLGGAGKSKDNTAKQHTSGARSGEGLEKKRFPDGRSDNEAEKRHRDARKDGGSSGGRRDSKAETDQSDASRNEDISEELKGLAVSGGSIDSNAKTDQSDAELTISKREEEQETAHGNETPLQQKRDSGIKSLGKGKRELFPSEREDGEWLEQNPWKCETPNSEEPTEKTVNESKVYTLSGKWLTDNDDVDLEKIHLNLPKFIDEIKGLSIRQELENILQIDGNALKLDTSSTLLKAIDFTKVKRTPHVLEITQKQDDVTPKDSPSRPGGNDNFRAFSLPPQQNQHEPSAESYWFLDCEYMLRMYLPDDSLQWFNHDDRQGKRIRKINPEKKDERWIFIPSFRRAKIALLDWPQDNIVTPESTIRVLVVRPSEFDEYVTYCGHKFPIICLPQDEIGAGYPRYWIQKIALRLQLQFIWMIDDSVKCFYEYHPRQKPPLGENGKANYTKYRRRKFGLVFQRIESVVKAGTKDDHLPIAAMSPRTFLAGRKLTKPFFCKPPRITVFLNLAALKSEEVYYRPELQVFEDMLFGYECEKNGLKVFIDNRIHQKDSQWTDTGAMSPSIKQNLT